MVVFQTLSFSDFLGDFDLQQLPFGRLWGLREWNNRVLMEKYFVSLTSSKPSLTFFNFLEPSLTFSNLLEPSPTFSNLLGPSLTFSDLLQTFWELTLGDLGPPPGGPRNPGKPYETVRQGVFYNYSTFYWQIAKRNKKWKVLKSSKLLFVLICFC